MTGAKEEARNACEPAIPLVRSRTACWWSEYSPAPIAPHLQPNNDANRSSADVMHSSCGKFRTFSSFHILCSSTCEHMSHSASKGRRRCSSACRPYHPDWGCSRRHAALVLVSFAVATMLPRAGGQLNSTRFNSTRLSTANSTMAPIVPGYLSQYATFCGDDVCDARLENRGWCPNDCSCGDGVCDDVEATSASCPRDCISFVDIQEQPSRISNSLMAFTQQPVLRILDVAKIEAFTPGIVTATLYQVVDDPTGTKKLNVPVGGLLGRTETPWSCGYAMYTDLVVSRAGVYTIQFQSIFLGTIFLVESWNFTIARGSVHHLGISQQPAGFRPDYAFKIQPVVLLQDVADNTILSGPESTIAVTASLTPDSPDVFLAPASRLVRAAQFGQIRFRDLFLPPGAIGKNTSLLFSVGNMLLPVQSQVFIVAEVARRLVVTNYPTFALAVEVFPRQPRVEVLDQFGNLCTWYEDAGSQNQAGIATDGIVVVAELIPPPGVAAAMLGEKSKLVVAGRVFYTDLSVNKPGYGYTIRFRATRGIVDPVAVQTFTTEPFNVTYGIPYRLVFDLKPGSDTEIQDPRGAAPGVPMLQQPRIMVQDRVGNVVGDPKGILEITATLLQNGKPALPPLKGLSVQRACLYRDANTGRCGCIDGPVSGCGIANWPVTKNGIRIDSVGKNFSLIFEASLPETYTDIDKDSLMPVQRTRFISLVPVRSVVFDVDYGVVHTMRLLEQPWGFVVNQSFLGQPVVAVYDMALNLVPTSDVVIRSHFVIVRPDGTTVCCFDQSYEQDTEHGYAFFKGVKLSKIPTQGRVLRLRFSSLSLAGSFFIETESFIMADTPIKIAVTQQPMMHLPGIGFTVVPKVSLLDANGTVAGWYKDAPMKVTAILCTEIPCVLGKFVGALRTATPCFKCTTDQPTFCEIQSQTPVLLKPRTIPSEREMIRGTMTSVAFDGVSTFTNLILDKIGTYKFKFTTPGYPTIESEPFTIFHGVAHHLYMQAEPQGASSDSPLSQQPVVVIQDAGNNIVTSDSTTIVTASLVNSRNIAGAKLKTANDNIMGPYVRVTHGALHWQRLQVDMVGTYQIYFTSSLCDTLGSSCINVTSQSFNIVQSPPAKLTVVKSPDLCRRGQFCKVQPVVEVQDFQGNRALVSRGINTSIAAISCTWKMHLTEKTLSEGRLTLNDFGIFENALWHTGCDGQYQLTFTSYGLQAAKSEIFQVSDHATNTTVVVSPSPVEAGSMFRQQPSVQLTDTQGRRVRGTNMAVTASLLKCDNGGPCKPFTIAPLIGTRTLNTTLAQSDYTNLRLDMAGTCYRFLFTSSGMFAGSSGLFDVKVGTMVSVLQVMTSPVPIGTIAGRAFPVQPVVAALDAGKNVMVFQNSLQITATLLIDAQSSVSGLLGDRTTVTELGVGTFTDLTVNGKGACFRLTFDVNGKAALSNTFYIGPANPARLHLAVEPSEPHVGWIFGVQPVIYFHDAFGNVVNRADCIIDCHLLNTTVIVSLLPLSFYNQYGEMMNGEMMNQYANDDVGSMMTSDQVLRGNKTIAFVSDPIFGTRASFTNLRIDRAGKYVLEFDSASGQLAPVVSQELFVMPAELRADRLEVIVQPYGIQVHSTQQFFFDIQPAVGIFDSGRNLIKSADTNVTATLLGGYNCGTTGITWQPNRFKCGPWVTEHESCGTSQGLDCQRTSGLVLRGTRTVATRQGIATFTDLWITGQPTRFLQLIFSSDQICTPSDSACISTKSYVFDAAGAASYLDLVENPSANVVAGEPFRIQPRVGIFDASGRRYTQSPQNVFQGMNVSSFQNVSTWCNSSQTREELAGTGYDCNINRTNTSALNISQFGVWDRLLGNRTDIPYLDGSVNFTGLSFNEVSRSRSGYHLRFSFLAPTGEVFTMNWCCVKVSPAKPNSLEIMNHPSEPRVGEPFFSQAQLRIIDRFGNLVTHEFGEVKAKLYQNHMPAPEGSVERVFGANLALAERGIVRFKDLGYNKSGENFTVAFIFPGVPLVFSTQFTIVPGNRIYYLHIARPALGFKENTVFTVQPIVETHDLGGNMIVLNDTDIPMIEATLVNGTTGAPYAGDSRLVGTTFVNASDGSANFWNLLISKAGTEMRLRFTLANSTVYTYYSEAIFRTILPSNTNQSAIRVPNGTFSNVSIYSIFIESVMFEVAKNETDMIFGRGMSTESTGGTVFKSQPIIHLKDVNDILVSNHEPIVISAQLWMYGSTDATCPSSRTSRCGILSGVKRDYDTACARNQADCPKLDGTTTQVLRYGVAIFSDLAIKACNELGKEACFNAKYKLRFTAKSSFADMIVETPPISIAVGKPVAAIIENQPVPGASGSDLLTQPSVLLIDAGGNAVTDWSQNASATLVRDKTTACCEQCDCPSWSGKTEVSPVKGVFNFQFAIDTAGDYKFRFATGIFTVESILFTVAVGAATHLRLIRQPLQGLGGSYFQTQPRLEVLDNGRNIVRNYVGQVKAELLPNEVGAKLTGIATVNVVSGMATFLTLAINKEGSCFVIRFASGPLRTADTIPITVDVGRPSRIMLIKQASGFRPGYAWDVQPIVAIVDEGENVVPTAKDTIQVTLLDANKNERPLCSFNLMGAPVCQTAVKAVNGIATFSGLRVDTASKGYTLVFGKERGGYSPATSPPFDVNVGAEFQLFVERELNQTTSVLGQPGFFFPVQPVVRIVDAGGNLVPVAQRRVSGELYRLNQPVSDTRPELWQVQMSLWDPSYTLQTTIDRAIGRPVIDGKATYTNLRVDVAANNYLIRFRSDDLLCVDSTIFDVKLGAAYSTKIYRQPAGVKSGMAFVVQPIVHIIDRGMNTLHGHNPTNPVYPMISSVQAGTGLMYPFPAESGIIPIRDGVSVYSRLTISGKGMHTIKFSAWSLQTDVTVPFNVSGESYAVSIKNQPIGSVAAVPMSIQPQTCIHDDLAIVVDTDSRSRVTATLVPDSNPNKAVLSGTLTVDCCWGECKFTDLVISKSGQKYQLTFTSPGLKTDISRPFVVGGPAKVVVNTQPSAAVSDLPIGNQPGIYVTDMMSVKQDYCNRDHCDIGGPAEVTATIKPGTGGLSMCKLTGNNVATVVNGVASFTDLGIQGAGRSFRERDYVLVFTAIDLYQTESIEFKLGYTARPPTNYVQAATQITRYSVFTFTTKEQTIFVNTIALYLGIPNTDVDLVSVKDVMVRFRNEIRSTKPNYANSTVPNRSSTRMGSTTSRGFVYPIDASPTETVLSDGMLPGEEGQYVMPYISPPSQVAAHLLTVEDELGSGQVRGHRRQSAEPGIDIRFQVFSNNTKDLVRIKEALTSILKREGALAEKLNDGGLSNIKTVMTELPEAYAAGGGILPPYVENSPGGAIAGALVGAFLLFSCGVGCYTVWWRARKRALIRSENDVDTMNLLFALGIEEPKEDLDAAMPWSAEMMLAGSSEKPKVVRNEGFGDNDDDQDKGKANGKAKEMVKVKGSDPMKVEKQALVHGGNMGLPNPSNIRRKAWICDRDDDQKKGRADKDDDQRKGRSKRRAKEVVKIKAAAKLEEGM